MQRSAQAAPERARLRRFAPPRSLAALLAIVVGLGLVWSLTVPPFQSPDELAHFAYAQGLAESFRLPGNPGRLGASSDESLADGSVGASRGAFWPQASPPDWNRADYAAYLAIEDSAHRPITDNGSGPSSADGNPPLYYLYAAAAYLIDHGGTAFGRLYAMRIAGVLLLALTTLGAWLLAGEVFARRRLPQLTAAAVAGLMPMVTFMSTSVNPDAMLITVWTLDLWLGARVINHRARDRDVIAIGALTAVAILTKATSYALVAPVLLAVLCGWLRRPAPERRSALAALVGGGVLLAAPVLGWVAIAPSLGGTGITTVANSAAHPFTARRFLSYVWQFYLPRLPFMAPQRTTPGLPAYDIWLRQGAGTFGWLDVTLPGWMYHAAAWLAGVIAVAGIALVTRLRNRRHLALLGFFALTLIALLGLLHITEYRALLLGEGQFLQGRYLLPVVGLLGLAFGLIVARIPGRARIWVCSLTITALLAVQVISLATIVQAYYL
ncbi:MAG TPA: DUF2142 domain-containing protein [Solirubrobacteraceae bacterium]|nr:DUF2142 domain-containing protein [Solirubrobacteraceae bacterium]